MDQMNFLVKFENGFADAGTVASNAVEIQNEDREFQDQTLPSQDQIGNHNLKLVSFSISEVNSSFNPLLQKGFKKKSDANAKSGFNAKANLNPTFDSNKKIWSNKIHFLKDVELESQLKYLVGRERQLLHLILKHIQEVDRRRLYAARAYSSLFEYLTKAMGYSFAAAQRRIDAARLMNQVPELSLKIQQGEVNLSQIGIITQAVKLKESQLGKKISSEVQREVIAEVAQKTTAQTQILVAEKLDLPLRQPERQMMQKDQSCVLSLTFTLEQQKKLQRCRELLAAKLQQGKKAFTTANYLEELMDFYLNKKDPCRDHRKQRNHNQDEDKMKSSEESGSFNENSYFIQDKDCFTKRNSVQNIPSKILFETNKSDDAFKKTSFLSKALLFEKMNFKKAKSDTAAESNSSSESNSISETEKRHEKARSSEKSKNINAIYEVKNVEQKVISKEEITGKQPLSKDQMTEQQHLSQSTSIQPKSVRRQVSLKKQIFQTWDSCQFHDPLTGRKCGEKFQLEMEHLHPQWAGGKDNFENRTLLCRTHNQWKYRQQKGLH